MSDDIVERLRAQGADAFSKQYSLGMWKLCAEAADEIERMRDALKLIALRNHPTTFTDDTDWYEVADCMVGIARRGLGEAPSIPGLEANFPSAGSVGRILSPEEVEAEKEAITMLGKNLDTNSQ